MFFHLKQLLRALHLIVLICLVVNCTIGIDQLLDAICTIYTYACTILRKVQNELQKYGLREIEYRFVLYLLLDILAVWSMYKKGELPEEHSLPNCNFYVYLHAVRHGFSLLHASGKLFQQCIVDAYVKTKGSRLNYLGQNQKDLRVEFYQSFCTRDSGFESRVRHGRRAVRPWLHQQLRS